MTGGPGYERVALAILAGGRLGIGAGIWMAPRTALRTLGFPQVDGRGLALARVVATRDLLLGGWLISATSDRDRLRTATHAAVVWDAADAIAFGSIAASGGQYATAGRRGVAGALAATVLGAWFRRRLNLPRCEQPPRQPAHGLDPVLERRLLIGQDHQ